MHAYASNSLVSCLFSIARCLRNNAASVDEMLARFVSASRSDTDVQQYAGSLPALLHFRSDFGRLAALHSRTAVPPDFTRRKALAFLSTWRSNGAFVVATILCICLTPRSHVVPSPICAFVVLIIHTLLRFYESLLLTLVVSFFAQVCDGSVCQRIVLNK